MARVQAIQYPDDFVATEAGLTLLDAVSMPLIGIGEELKAVDKHVPPEYFADHANVDWKGLKGMRDRLSHGYFFIDNEAVFNTAKEEIPDLKIAVIQIRARIEAEHAAS
ncbi:MAG: DUF86 domain-containing protein [Fimbriimonas sp.]